MGKIKNRKPGGFFNRMTNDEFLNYVREHHSKASLNSFRKTDRQAYRVANGRNLVDKLVEEEILIRELRKRGLFLKLSDDEFIDYVIKNYSGCTLTDFSEKDGSAYNIARKRNLLDRLVNEGVLVRELRRNFFTKMSDDGLVD